MLNPSPLIRTSILMESLCEIPATIRRISRLEMLDELEEWRLLARHYCIAWAYRVPLSGSSDEDIRLFDGMRFEEHEREGANRIPPMFPRG